MSVPTPRFYLGFDSTWKTENADITWTEVTSYVLVDDVTVTRGRSSELDEFRAGTASLTLKNLDRRFDPMHTAGPYFGKLLPGVPFKVTGTANATTAPVARGFVEGWPQDYDAAARLAVVNLRVVDGFGKLASAATRVSVHDTEVLADTPEAFWKLDERAGGVMTDSSGNEHHGRYDNPGLGENPLVADAGAAARFDHVGDHRGLVTGRTMVDGYPFTVECWVNFYRDPGATHTFLVGMHDQSNGVRIELSCPTDASGNTAGAVQATVSDAVVGNAYIVRGTNSIGDGAPHHLVAVFNNATSITLYRDGAVDPQTVVNAGTGASGAVLATWQLWTVGNFPDLSNGDFGAGGLVDEVAVYRSGLSSGRVADHYDAGTIPWDGDLTGARLARILDIPGWPDDLRDITTGLTIMGAATLGANVLTLAKRVEAVEQGRMFISRDGKLTLLDRYYHQTSTKGTVVQATFSDDGADIPYSGFAFDFDNRMVYNRIRASRPRGGVVEVLDQDSIDTYGEQIESSLSNLDVPSDNVVRSAAEYRLSRYKDPQLRIRPIELKLGRLTAAQQAAVLALELGYRVTIERTPQGVGSAVTQDCLVEGISHRIGDRTWTTTLQLSPADTVLHAMWDVSEWDDPLTLWGY